MQVNFKDPATAVMEAIIDFHHDLQVYLIIIVCLVSNVLLNIIYVYGVKNYNFWGIELEDILEQRKNILVTKNVTHNSLIEIIWTLIPVCILIAIAIPSFTLLYFLDEIVMPVLSVKVIGYQWYWRYEYTDYAGCTAAFDSFGLPEDALTIGDLRLLEVDKQVWVPEKTSIRFIITANDVLHSWAVPSLGIKMDAIPGRLNQVSASISREGIFYGQCSELCGVNHGFMPIVVRAVPMYIYSKWINFLYQTIV